jgi:hypothetical protein
MPRCFRRSLFRVPAPVSGAREKNEYLRALFVPGCFLVVLVGQGRQCLGASLPGPKIAPDIFTILLAQDTSSRHFADSIQGLRESAHGRLAKASRQFLSQVSQRTIGKGHHEGVFV